jgi:hypothetical protein
MARRTITAWVSALAAAALAACGVAPAESATFGADASEPEQQALDDRTDGVEPDVSSEEAHERGTHPDEPDEEACGAGSAQDGDDSGTPWHLLPDADRPAPVEQPKCDRASPTPVAC